MEDDSKNVLLYKLLIEKRRALAELRGKVIMARERNESGNSVTQSIIEGEQEDCKISIWKTSQNAKESQNHSTEVISDDSMKDRSDWSFPKILRRTPEKTGDSRGVEFPADLPCLRQEEKPISSAKYKDLMDLLQWVPQEFHGYYKDLKHSTDESDFPEAD